jgi:hypothetical protein
MQALYPRMASRGHYEPLRVDLGIIVERHDARMVGVASNMHDPLSHNNPDSLLMETPCQELTHLGVFIHEQVLPAGNQRDIGAIETEHLSNLDGLTLSSQNDQMLRGSRRGRGLSRGPVSDV